MQLASQGRHARALIEIQEYLLRFPRDGQALNDAGVVLHALGRHEQAADHLRKAIRYLGHMPAEAMGNLVEVYLAAKWPDDIVDMLEDLDEVGLLTGELAQKVARCFIDLGDTAAAADVLKRCRQLAPQQRSALQPIVDELHAARPKVAMFCPPGHTQYLQGLTAHLADQFQARLSSSCDTQEMFNLLQWCDVAWFEWCTDELVAASRAPKTCHIIARLHHEEAYGDLPTQVRWENVDVLLTPGQSAVVDVLTARVPQLPELTTIMPVPVGIDTEAIAFRARSAGTNLVCLDDLTPAANPIGLLQAFAELHLLDPAYSLHLTGRIDDECIAHSVRDFIDAMGLTAAIHFSPYPADLDAYLAEKHYVISARHAMGQPVEVMQAMAAGLKPIVYAFPGCGEFLREAWTWRTPEELCRRVLDEAYRPAEYRQAVQDMFALPDQAGQINDILHTLVRNPLPCALAGRRDCEQANVYLGEHDGDDLPDSIDQIREAR